MCKNSKSHKHHRRCQSAPNIPRAASSEIALSACQGVGTRGVAAHGPALCGLTVGVERCMGHVSYTRGVRLPGFCLVAFSNKPTEKKDTKKWGLEKKTGQTHFTYGGCAIFLTTCPRGRGNEGSSGFCWKFSDMVLPNGPWTTIHFDPTSCGVAEVKGKACSYRGHFLWFPVV